MCLPLAILSSSTTEKSKLIEEIVLEILQKYPDLTYEEYRSYHISYEEIQSLMENEYCSFDEKGKQKFIQIFSTITKEEDERLYRELYENRLQYIKDENTVVQWTKLENSEYQEALESCYYSRKQELKDRKSTYSVKIDFFKHEGRVYLGQILNMRCINNCN